MDRKASALAALNVAWWVYLVSATAWFVIAWVVLRFDVRTVAAVSVLAGIVILMAGLAELFTAFVAPGWRWLHALLGVVFVLTGTVAFFRPGGTFAMLAALIGWYLLFKGLLDITLAFATKPDNDAWWLGLIIGIIEVGLGFWAAGSFGRSAALLVVFVGAIALTRGITDVMLAFRLREAEHDLRRDGMVPA
jgi:uncharacterized membrane protein HdeD (DUF308 family)